MTDLCITCKENSAHIIRISILSTERLNEVSQCMHIYSIICIIGNTKSNRAQKLRRQREELLQNNINVCFGGFEATFY